MEKVRTKKKAARIVVAVVVLLAVIGYFGANADDIKAITFVGIGKPTPGFQHFSHVNVMLPHHSGYREYPGDSYQIGNYGIYIRRREPWYWHLQTD